SFSPELLEEWDWKHYFSKQSDTEEYLNLVADKFDLRRHIRFNSRVGSARWLEEELVWEIKLDSGESARADFLVPAVGHLSAAFIPPFPGSERFKGDSYHTVRWPREAPDFSGKRVAVIGTGATGIQLIPELAKLC